MWKSKGKGKGNSGRDGRMEKGSEQVRKRKSREGEG